MSELEPRHEMNEAQEIALRNLCARYHVEFDPSHYFVFPPNSFMMANWAEGWVGGQEIQGTSPTIYVGVSPEGQAHS